MLVPKSQALAPPRAKLLQIFAFEVDRGAGFMPAIDFQPMAGVTPPLHFRILKRVFDLLTVLITAPFWVPVVLVVAIVVRFKLGSPVFFRQKRPGLRGEIFELIKFRTMRDAFDSDGRPLPDAER